MPSAVQDKEDKRFEQRLTPTQLTMVSAVYDHPIISPIENISIEYYPNPADTGRTIVGGGCGCLLWLLCTNSFMIYIGFYFIRATRNRVWASENVRAKIKNGEPSISALKSFSWAASGFSPLSWFLTISMAAWSRWSSARRRLLTNSAFGHLLSWFSIFAW